MNLSFIRFLPRRVAALAAPFALLVLAAPLARAEVPSPTVPAVDHYVYLRFLPKASELTQDAQINGLTILRIDELPDRVIVSYQYPDGHHATLGYALLGSNVGAPATRSATVTTSTPTSTARYVVSERDPEVVYVAPPTTTTRVYYYSDPWYNYWAPITVGFGIGWASGYYGGHYHNHGHYYGGHHGGYHGGYHGGGGHGGYHGGGGHGGGHGGRGRY